MNGLLVVTPYYNRPSQPALIDHFTAIAAAGDSLPILIYDIPVRTGRKVDTETLLTLAYDVDNIIGIKDAAGDPAETASLLTQAPDGFEIYSGDDKLTLPLMSIGAVGAIGVATHWTGPEHVQMFDAFANGDVVEARQLNALMLPSFSFESMLDAPNPIPTKAMLRMLGHRVGHGRSPMHVGTSGPRSRGAGASGRLRPGDRIPSTGLAATHVRRSHDHVPWRAWRYRPKLRRH